MTMTTGGTAPRTLRAGAHDFDSQTGRWLVRNERLQERLNGCTEWEIFEASNEAHLLPGGLGNMDYYLQMLHRRVRGS